MTTFLIAKVRSGKKPYNITTVHDLPTDPIVFHSFMRDQVCKRYGYGIYSITRSNAYGEKRGYKGVWLGAIQPEGVTTYKTYSKHPVFPGEPFKKMWWEKGDMRQHISIPKFEDSMTKVVRAALASDEHPKTLKVKKGIVGFVKACLKEED